MFQRSETAAGVQTLAVSSCGRHFFFFFEWGQICIKAEKQSPWHFAPVVENCMMKAAAFLFVAKCNSECIVLCRSHLHGWRLRSAASLRLIGAQSDGAISDGCPAFRAGYPVCMLMLLDVLCGPVFARTKQMELSCAGCETDGGATQIWDAMHMQWGVALGTPTQDFTACQNCCWFNWTCCFWWSRRRRIFLLLSFFLFSFFFPCDVLHDDGVGLS